MNSFITVKYLADMLGIDRRNFRKEVIKEKVKTFKAPVMTRKGPQMALWVRAS
jgi:myosin heavy subunit